MIYLREEKLATVNEKKNKDQYELTGYAGDIVHYNIYDNKLVIQGRSLCVFGIIINYLSRKSLPLNFSGSNLSSVL